MKTLHAVGPEWVDGVLALYADAWWTSSRTRDEVAALLAASDAAVGLVDDDGLLVAFARALSDGTHRAVVFDVIVASARQRDGLGADVTRALLDHPAVRDVESVALWCKPEHMEFYRKLGFSDDVHDLQLMLRGDVDGS